MTVVMRGIDIQCDAPFIDGFPCARWEHVATASEGFARLALHGVGWRTLKHEAPYANDGVSSVRLVDICPSCRLRLKVG